ncbi:hypothetical protein ACFFU8_10095 [Chromobacterium piscinae]|uniref:hypothetical protein n=1 Tax=Chromobacterium piscinae TaxID=686831 RepID=UPI001E449120|nr:hypothetical protein [Chromobacterium piscinae]MCD5326451.1 hypothetical protein [Chromobacterium piscinae]
MSDSLLVQIASLPDRDNVVFEIFQSDRQLAEVYYESEEEGVRIQIFPLKDGVIDLDLTDFISALIKAKSNLVNC